MNHCSLCMKTAVFLVSQRCNIIMTLANILHSGFSSLSLSLTRKINQCQTLGVKLDSPIIVLRKSWESSEKVLRKSWESPGKFQRKSWNSPEVQSWKSHEKVQRKSVKKSPQKFLKKQTESPQLSISLQKSWESHQKVLRKS